MTVEELLRKNGIALDNIAPGRHYAPCPRCSKDRRKPGHKNAACLGVTIERDGVHWGCNHCGWSGPERGSSAPHKGQTRYDYVRADGALLFQKVRNPPGHEPRFWCRRPDGAGGWISNVKGINNKPLYRWPQVVAAIDAGREVAIVEGEKDVDSLWQLEIPATCNFDGTSDVIRNPNAKPKWKVAYSEALRGASVVVFNDNDAPGYAHAETICKLSLGVAQRVRRLDLAPHWPEIPKGGDVSDYLAAGHTAAQLAALIAGALDYAPSDKSEAAAGEPASGQAASDDDAELEKLARMSRLDFERARAEAAKRLGIRAALLDKLVQAKRGELGLDGDDGRQGRAIELPEPEPWPEPVDGAALLDDIAAAVRRHVVLPDYARDACALWIAHSYLLDRLMITPRLAVTSPTRGCGKTTLLDVIAALVFRPLPAANCSASSVFRVVEGFRPCLLIDEADSFLSENEQLRGVLNSGHRRGGAVLRNVGDEHEPRSFSTFAACAIALIGQLPSTLADRSLPIDLIRRKRDEAIEPFRFDRVDHLTVLARKLLRWSRDNADAIAATEPQMPAGLYNRTADNWRPLMAIATVAGAEWLARGHRAALQCVGADVDEGSQLELLLGDVRSIFGGMLDTNGARISSAEIIEKLCAIEPRPWSEFGRAAKPITQNQLARLFKPLGIAPVQIRVGGEKTRGYGRHQFDEAFERYLSPREGDGNRYAGTNAMDEGLLDISQPVQPEGPYRLENAGKPSNDSICTGVPVGKGETGDKGLSAPTIDALADWYDETHYSRRDEPEIEARLDQELRCRLREEYGVFPEFIETEAERVKERFFSVVDTHDARSADPH